MLHEIWTEETCVSVTACVLQSDVPSKYEEGSENGKKDVTSVSAGKCIAHTHTEHMFSHHEKAVINFCIATHTHL